MASTEDDLFASDRGRRRPRRFAALLEEQPWLATDRDDDGVSALMRARYQMDRGLVAAVRAHVAELDVFEAAAFGDLDRLSELLAADPELVERHERRRVHAAAPGGVLRTDRRGAAAAGARRRARRRGTGMDDRHAR